MLYDLVPPTIFFLSLGGVILVMARATVRLRRAEFSASVKSTAISDTTPTVLRPNQKSVQAFSSRVGLVGHWFKSAYQQIVGGLHSLPARWRQRGENRRAAQEVGVASNTSPAAAPTTEPTPAAGIVIPPTRRGLMAAVRSRLGGATQRVGQQGKHWGASARAGLGSVRTRLRRTPQPDHEPLETQERTSMNGAAEEPTPTSPAPTSTVAETKLHQLLQGVRAQSTPIKARVTTRRVVTTTAPAPPAKNNALAGFRRRHGEKTAGHLQQAEVALQAAEYQRAEDLLLDHIVKNTKDMRAYVLLGQVALARKNWREAIEIFEQVVSWKPESEGAYAGLGLAAYHAGKYGRALQALQRAHEADPTNKEILEALLVIAQRMDNPALQHSIQEKLDALSTEKEAAPV